jgi:hypothetical protein
VATTVGVLILALAVFVVVPALVALVIGWVGHLAH